MQNEAQRPTVPKPEKSPESKLPRNPVLGAAYRHTPEHDNKHIQGRILRLHFKSIFAAAQTIYNKQMLLAGDKTREGKGREEGGKGGGGGAGAGGTGLCIGGRPPQRRHGSHLLHLLNVS